MASFLGPEFVDVSDLNNQPGCFIRIGTRQVAEWGFVGVGVVFVYGEGWSDAGK